MPEPPPRVRVLVVDDDQSLRRILALFLQTAQYQTIEARNGREALELARHHKPDLILLDVMMPGLDGFACCKLLKDDPETHGVPVLMCTAKNYKEDLIAAIKAGAEDFIVKPFTKEIVLQKVDRALKARNSPSSTKLIAVERRSSRRRSAGWALSWGAEGTAGLAPIYKTKVLDISVKGFSFEFNRCDICTGYEQATVHPLCLFAKHAKRFREAEEVEFVLSIKKDTVVEVRGKIAHVLQKSETPRTERVGVAFTVLPEEGKRIIEQHLAESLAT